jgi:hypothetical protein
MLPAHKADFQTLPLALLGETEYKSESQSTIFNGNTSITTSHHCHKRLEQQHIHYQKGLAIL